MHAFCFGISLMSSLVFLKQSLKREVQWQWGNSSEIKKVTIDFRSNFVHWIFIIWELQFWNKKRGCPCSLRSNVALKMSYFSIINDHLCHNLRTGNLRIPSINVNFCDRDFREHFVREVSVSEGSTVQSIRCDGHK